MSQPKKSGWAALNAAAYVKPTRGAIAYYVSVLTLAVAVLAGWALRLVDEQAVTIAMRFAGFALLWGYLVVRRRQHRKK